MFREIGGYDENFGHNCEDTDVHLRIALKSCVHFIAEKLVCYRLRAGQAGADAQLYNRQVSKLYEKWLNDRSLTESERKLVRKSELPSPELLTDCSRLLAGKTVLGQRKYVEALRFWHGAMRR